MILLLVLPLLLFVAALRSGEGWRDRFLRAVTLFGLSIFAVTETLSAFAALRRGLLVVCWSALCIVAAFFAGRRKSRDRIPRLDPFAACCALAIGVILSLTAITAALSPPNSADAMAYHMPRV